MQLKNRIISSPYNATYDQRWLEDVFKTKYGHAQVGEHTRLGHEWERAKYLLHGYARHRGQIKVGIVRHDQASEQNGHYAREFERFGKHIRRVHKYEHKGCLERWRSSQIDVFEELFENKNYNFRWYKSID